MMKIPSVLLSLILFSFFARGQNTADKYTIYAPQGISAETRQDFKYLLDKATGKSWQIHSAGKNTSHGIFLQLANENAFQTRESFRLQSNGTDKLTISSSSAEGLIFGFYKHLRQLGFQFFLPGEDYTIIPKLDHPFGTRKNVVDRPFLQIRNFFGTGGFGSNNSDPGKLVEKAWLLWKLRNGFGSAYELGGHRGENFVLENKEILKKNPQWLATPLTGQPSDNNIKLNYLNKEAVDFYTDWSIKNFTQPGFVLPPSNHTQFISIEPSDGGGYLNEYQKNKSLPSISDQVYGAANLAAQKLDKLFPNHPNIGVNLYAYSSHAAPPSFKLHPRVFVQLIPYQFQNVAFGPSFIKLWASKLRRFGLYDYFNYPDAQFDLPGGLTIDEAMKRLVHSVKNGSEGTHYETSYSKFAAGIPLWLLGRYMMDGDANWKKNLETLTISLYGASSSKLAEVFSIFYNDPSFGPQHLGRVAGLLKEGSALTIDATVQKRLIELKQYLHYIHLVYQSRNLNNGPLHQRLLPVADYAWKIYPQKIVHSYRIMQLVSYAFLNIDKADKDFSYYQKLHVDWFPETDRRKSSWNRIKQEVTGNETEKDFALIQKNYQAGLPLSQFSFKEIQPLIASGFTPRKTLVIGGDASVRGYFGIYADKPTTLSIRYKINGARPALTFSCVDQNYTKDTAIVVSNAGGTISLQLPAGETTIFLNAGDGSSYRIQADITNGLYFFDGSPRGKLAFYKNFNDPYESYTYAPAYYPSHFFVPKNIPGIEYKVQLNALAITTANGRKISSDILLTEHGGVEIRKFTVQPSEAGRIWRAEVSGNYNYSLLNIPDRYMLLESK